MNLLPLYLLFYANLIECIELSPGKPVPGAIDLRRMLLKHVFGRTSEVDGGSIRDYLMGNFTEFDETPPGLDVLDVDSIKEITKMAKKKYYTKKDINSRRVYEGSMWKEDWRIVQNYDPELSKTLMDLMKQSIYEIREDLKKTKKFRQLFLRKPSYRIGLLHGCLMQIRNKMENLYATMRNFPFDVKFIFFLFTYEKILAAHVDVTFMVRRMFVIHSKVKKGLAGGDVDADYTTAPPSKSKTKRKKGRKPKG